MCGEDPLVFGWTSTLMRQHVACVCFFMLLRLSLRSFSDRCLCLRLRRRGGLIAFECHFVVVDRASMCMHYVHCKFFLIVATDELEGRGPDDMSSSTDLSIIVINIPALHISTQ